MGKVYIQTNKFYTIPKFEEYHQTKNQHLQEINSHYANLPTTDEKWTSLMTHLADSLSQTHMPNGVDVRAFKERLAVFTTKRKGTANSYFNLSLTQCINYFEEFDFLYQTVNPGYKLTDAAKKDLLQSIDEAMDVCETGLNGRLYTALQAHQKESDWIQNELVKARCETLRILHTEYGGADVHDYNYLVKLANNAQLGIPQHEDIMDIHGRMIDSTRLTDFFNERYPALFSTYEKNIEDTLTNHYLNEMAAKLEINISAWNAGQVTITSDKTRDIITLFTSYFQGVPAEGLLDESLGELSADCTKYTLKSKHHVAHIINGLVSKKLIADQYIVSLTDIASNRAAYTNLRLKKGVVLDELIKLHNTLQAKDLQKIKDNLQHHPVILMSYPELVISQIDSHPAILSSVPKWMRSDTRFIDSSIVILDKMLCEAIKANNADTIRTLTAQILDLIQSEHGYLQQLSKIVLEHQIVKSGLMLPNPNTMPNVNRTNKAKKALMNINIVTQLVFFEHVNALNPQSLLDVIAHRKQLSMPPLPFFNKDTTCQDLDKFNRELQNRLNADWNNGYLSIKRRACEQENFAFIRDPLVVKNAVTFLAKTDGWFAGFNQYHAYQSSNEKLSAQLWIESRALCNFIISMTKIGLSVAAIYYVFPVITSIVQLYFAGFMWISLFLWILNFSLQSPLLNSFFEIVWLLATLDGQFLGLMISIILTQMISAYEIFNDILDAPNAMLGLIKNAFSYFTSNNEYLAETLEDTCENIVFRLNGINEATAEEKGDILRLLLTAVKADVNSNPSSSFKKLLGKEYNVSYHGNMIQTSFSAVARTRRAHNSAFNLNNQHFFSLSTTTESLLKKCESVENTLNR